MNGNLLALGAISVLALGASARRGNRNVPSGSVLGPLYHGTKACDAVLRHGSIEPSLATEVLPTIFDVARARRTVYSEASLRRAYRQLVVNPRHVHSEALFPDMPATWVMTGGNPGKPLSFAAAMGDDDVRGDLMVAAFEDLEKKALTAMRFYGYATTNVLYAEHYSIGHGTGSGCILEVEGDVDAIVPDEDWMGSAIVALNEVPGAGWGARKHERPGFERFFGDPAENFEIRPLPGLLPRPPIETPSFVAWGVRVLDVLEPAMLGRLDRVMKDLQEDNGYDLLLYKAALGRTVIRHALESDAGRAWLREGLTFATSVAHRGAMRIVQRVELPKRGIEPRRW